MKSKIEKLIPDDAHSFEVFAIKECSDSPTGKQAFIGFKLSNGDFHFIGVPFTEPSTKQFMKSKFKVGDKLKANDFDKEQYELEFVTITSINHKNKVYHWEAKSILGGTIHSGYFFNEAELYEK